MISFFNGKQLSYVKTLNHELIVINHIVLENGLQFNYSHPASKLK